MTLRFGLAAAMALAAAGFLAPAQAAGCSVGVTKAWAPEKNARAYVTEAYANGVSCANAVVTIVVRGAGGDLLWADAMASNQLMTFADVKTRARMKAGLIDWLTQQHTFKSSGDLPEWKKGADAPEAGEFPFHPEPGVDRETYMQIRAEKQAMFCYVQGMESMSCIAIAKDGAVTKVGVQQFPG